LAAGVAADIKPEPEARNPEAAARNLVITRIIVQVNATRQLGNGWGQPGRQARNPNNYSSFIELGYPVPGSQPGRRDRNPNNFSVYPEAQHWGT